MRLKELKRSRTGDRPYVATLDDTNGDFHYELAISGPDELVKKVFAKSDFEWRIEPKVAEKDVAGRNREMWDRYASAGDQANEPETIASLSKAAPKAATARNSVVVSLRRTQGEGTWWWMWFPTLLIPAGYNLFVILPPVCNAFGFTVPHSGDPDLLLMRNGPFFPPVSASTLRGTAVDRVAFGPSICWPWEEFFPWFRVIGVTTGVTDFGMGGFGVVP